MVDDAVKERGEALGVAKSAVVDVVEDGGELRIELVFLV